MKKIYVAFIVLMLCVSAEMGFAQENRAAFHNSETYVEAVLDATTLKTLSQDFSIDRVQRNADGTFNTRIWLSYKDYDNFLAREIPYTVAQPTRATVTMATNYSEMVNGWNRYPTYSTYLAMMDTFQTRYPNLCKIDTILAATPGGRKVLCAHISNNLNDNMGKPSIFYTSTMHGDEVVGYYFMLRLIDMLLTNYNSNTRLTNMVNNFDIWICPLHNPDGTYHSSDNQINTSPTSTRANAHSVDLNRSFPQAGGSIGSSYEPEVSAMMQFLGAHNFTIAANFHGGAEVFNYPWDAWTTSSHAHADDAWWQYVGRKFADTCHTYSSSYFTEENNGITEGGDWYVITGSMQDYHNWFLGSRHATIEVGDKVLNTSVLPNYWGYAYHSLLNFIEEAGNGIHGTVTDSLTGEPLQAMVYVNNHDADHSYVETTLPHGDYHRPIKAGQYSVTYSAEGYHSKTITLNVSDGAKLTKNVQLVSTDTNSCRMPKYVTVNYNGGTSATVTWSSTAQSCNLKVNDLQMPNVTSPCTLSSLASSTHYDVQVQADCGDGDLSDWTDPVGFTTDCLAQDKCELTFELTDSWGDSWNGAAIRVVDASTGEILGELANENLNGSSNSGENEVNTKTLSVCNGKNINFVWVSGSYDNECSYVIYDVFGDVILSGSGALATTSYTVECGASACAKPNSLVVMETTGTKAKLSWTENGTATAWQICLNDDETNLINVTTNPYTLTGLTAEASYTVKVRANCGNEQSRWSNVVSFVPSDKMTIGSGTTTSSYLPLHNYYNYSLTQQIYTTAELGAAGNILSIDFYKNSTVQCNRNLDIYMVSTTKSEFSSNTDWIPVTDANKVFSGTVNFANNDWTTITLTTSFAYNGTNNVAIVVDDNTGSYKSNTNFLVFPTDGTYQAIYYYNDNNNYNPTNSPSTASGRLTSKNQMRVHINRPDSVVCLAPTDLAVVEFDHQSAMLNWSGEADSWTVAYRASNEEQFTEDNTSDTVYMLTGLLQLTEYTVRVAANCGEETVWCEEITFSTLPVPCPAPTDVMVTNVDRNSAVVSWTETGDATSWVVAYRSDIDELFTEVEISEPTYTLSDLAEGTLYVVKVRPVCDGVTDSWSDTEFSTDSCHSILLTANEPTWTENFDNYTQSTTAVTDKEPDCWELVRTDAPSMPDNKRPQIYYKSDFAHSGSYSLLLNYRGVYAMPAISEEVTIQDVKLEMYLRQPNAAYQLEVGVWDDATSTFMPVAVFNNATTEVEQVMCDFSGYTGDGRRIAFRNTLGSGKTWSYSYNYMDDITLTLLGTEECTLSLEQTETFEDYTEVTAAATGVEPDCWELVMEEVQMPDNKKPQLYYRSDFAHSGDYSLLLNYRGVYAMPSLDATDADISDLHLSMYLRQPNAAYMLEVGVWEPNNDPEQNETGVFVPVHVFNNKTTGVTFVECDFSNYTGNGGRIAFRNTLGNGRTWNYSYNYLDDIALTLTGAKIAESSSANAIDAMGADRDMVDFVVYPNPTRDYINVQCTMNNVQCSGIEVIDVYGKVVRTVVGVNNDSPTQINVSGLAAGMYFVRVTTDEGVVTKPFVKR